MFLLGVLCVLGGKVFFLETLRFTIFDSGLKQAFAWRLGVREVIGDRGFPAADG
jgi:hypothetical protein